MKTKTILKVCAICIGVGMVFTVVGYAFGGGNNRGLGNIVINGNRSGVNNKYYDKENLVNIDEKLDSFENIELNAETSDIKIIPSDSYKIEATYNQRESKLEYEVKDNTLILNQKNIKKNISNNTNDKYRIEIYVPKDIILENMGIDSNLANIVLKDLNINNLNLDCNLGNIIIRNCKIENSLVAETDMGNIEIEGKLYGRIDIQSNLGNIELQLDEKEENYNYDIKNSLGKISINRNNHTKSVSKTNNSKNNITIECSVGNIDINFN